MKFHKRSHEKAIEDCEGLTLEEAGAYDRLINLTFERGSALLDKPGLLAGYLDCGVRVWARIRRALIEKGKLRSDGSYLAIPWVMDQLSEYAGRQETGRSTGARRRGDASVISENSNEISKTSEATLRLPSAELEGRKRVENLAKPESKTSDSEFSPPGASREISIEDMARSIYDRMAPLAKVKTGHDPMRIRQALERRAALGEDVRQVARAAYALASDPWQRRDGGRHAAQLHKLIEAGFPPLWVQSGKTLVVPQTVGGQPLIWSPPEGPIASPTPVPALSTITVDGHSFEVPADVDPGMNSVWAERTIRHQLERIQEWRTDYRGLWQSNAWGPEPGKPGCRIWPSVLAFAGVTVEKAA